MVVQHHVTGRWYRELPLSLVVPDRRSLGWLSTHLNMRMFIWRKRSAERIGRSRRGRRRHRRLATTMIILAGRPRNSVGVLGDKWGRVKTMATAVLVYSGLPASPGCAVAGRIPGPQLLQRRRHGRQFSWAVALLRRRFPTARGPSFLAAASVSAVGNIIGSLIGYAFLPEDWRYVFFVGAVPVLLAILTVTGLQEPAAWRRSVAASHGKGGARRGSYRELFMGNPFWRTRALIGGAIGAVGVTGMWGVSFYSPELVGHALTGLDAESLAQQTTVMTICQVLGRSSASSASRS